MRPVKMGLDLHMDSAAGLVRPAQPCRLNNRKTCFLMFHERELSLHGGCQRKRNCKAHRLKTGLKVRDDCVLCSSSKQKGRRQGILCRETVLKRLVLLLLGTSCSADDHDAVSGRSPCAATTPISGVQGEHAGYSLSSVACDCISSCVPVPRFPDLGAVRVGFRAAEVSTAIPGCGQLFCGEHQFSSMPATPHEVGSKRPERSQTIASLRAVTDIAVCGYAVRGRFSLTVSYRPTTWDQ